MAESQQNLLWIGVIAFFCATAPPAASFAQTPAQKGGDAAASGVASGAGVVKCTEAAPCAAPGGHAKPSKIVPGAAAVHQFREKHPCPTTAHTWGTCPGYVVTHIKPPCKGGLDEPANLQWQTHSIANQQDRTACR